MTFTYMGIQDGCVKVVITNVVTGSGGFPEQGVEIRFCEKKGKLVCENVEAVEKRGHGFR